MDEYINYEVLINLSIIFYSSLYIILAIITFRFTFRRINEIQYENLLWSGLNVHILLSVFMFCLAIILLNHPAKYLVLFVILNILPIPLYHQIWKKDTPFKRYEIEKEQLKKHHEEIIRRNVLLNEIKLKEENLDKQLDVFELFGDSSVPVYDSMFC
jgi:hypothetical protein